VWLTLVNALEYQGIVENLREYNLKKHIKEQLNAINPILVKKETELKVHFEKAIDNGLITKNEAEFLEIKMELGRMCLELEQVLDGIYVTMLFYDPERNHVFHGACPSGPVEFFDFFSVVNEQGLLNEDCASCGRAIFTQEVVQTDIETSPLWSQLKDHVLSFGFKSCTSIPFYSSDGKVAGTFAHYSNKPNNMLTLEEIEMIQEKTSMFSEEIQRISDRLQEYTKTGNTGLTI
jgi:GAF domain-containing protein